MAGKYIALATRVERDADGNVTKILCRKGDRLTQKEAEGLFVGKASEKRDKVAKALERGAVLAPAPEHEPEPVDDLEPAPAPEPVSEAPEDKDSD